MVTETHISNFACVETLIDGIGKGTEKERRDGWFGTDTIALDEHLVEVFQGLGWCINKIAGNYQR